MQGRVVHRIDVVLMTALCSMLSDDDTFTDREAFAKSQLEWLRTFLPLENGAPSHDVFRNVFIWTCCCGRTGRPPGWLVVVERRWISVADGRETRIGTETRGDTSKAARIPSTSLADAEDGHGPLTSGLAVASPTHSHL